MEHHQVIMFPPWRFKLREAQVALDQGRLEEAARLVGDPALAQFLPVRQLQSQIATQMARRALERAAALYPEAQTPLVALSELAVRRGDRSAAAAALQGLVAGSADRSPGSDPWWAYDVSYARDADALLGRLRSWLAAEYR